MNKKKLGSLVLGCGMVFAAVVVAQTPDGTPPPPTAEKTPAQMDRMFVRKAAEGGMAEVKLGQLAAQKGTNPDVKTFGQKMVDDHTNLNNQMMPIAQKLGVTPPDQLNAKDQATYDKLNGLSGDDFDKAYMQGMVMDHCKDLREFKHEEATTADPDLKAVVATGEKVIAGHLKMANHVAEEVGVTAPPPHANAQPAQ